MINVIPTINPLLRLDKRAKDAVKFYVSIFLDSKILNGSSLRRLLQESDT